jgi:uncharacterized membrane protein YphA (DoxX/SURF4 family)
MTFSQYAGVAIVPTLSRIVLCLAFVSTGYNKVFKQAEYTAEEATRLQALGVNVTPSAAPGATPTASLDGSRVFRPASYIQDGGQPTDPDTTPPQTQTPVQTAPAASDPSGTVIIPGSPLPPGTYRAAGMYKVALILSSAGWRQPVWLARLAAYTELVGGALLALGLFSRIWGLGLAIAMAVAFYLVSVQGNQVLNTDPRVFAEDIANFNTLYAQLGLFVLAFGIFLTGPGPLSLDRLLFGGGRREVVDTVKV